MSTGERDRAPHGDLEGARSRTARAERGSALERLRTGRARFVLWGLVVVLVATPFVAPAEDGAATSPVERLLGPFAETAASVQWVRADLAWRRGREAEGYALAASALELAPTAPGGWIFLARHFAYQRAALEREPDPAARRQWMQAAFEALDRGGAAADGGGALSFERGVILSYAALIAAEPDVPEAERPWPGSPEALFEAAAAAFDQAALRGDPEADGAARSARERAAEARGRSR